MNGHDREQLAEGPVIEQRLKNGEVADVLVAERGLEFFYFVGDKPKPAMHPDDLRSQLPINGLDLGF